MTKKKYGSEISETPEELREDMELDNGYIKDLEGEQDEDN